MNFNVYINKPIGEKLDQIAKSLHRSRNSIIKEALEEWIAIHAPSSWPKNFFDFEPVKNVPDFKASRKELKKKIKEDPLA